MKVKCIVNIEFFTEGKVYDVVNIDSDGDIWVKEDDVGQRFFMHPRECIFIPVNNPCPRCNGSGSL